MLFLCGSAHASDCGFRVHKAGVDQYFGSGAELNTYSPVTFPSETVDPTYKASGFDLGDKFTSSAWVPVPQDGTARMVSFSGQIWIAVGGAWGSGSYYVARIVKNGYPAGVSIGAAIATKGCSEQNKSQSSRWNLGVETALSYLLLKIDWANP